MRLGSYEFNSVVYVCPALSRGGLGQFGCMAHFLAVSSCITSWIIVD